MVKQTLQDMMNHINVVIWKFTPDTPTDKLLRYHRIFRWIIKICMYASVGLIASTAQGLIFGISLLDLILIAVFCILSLGLIIPMLFAFCFIDEVETLLQERGEPYPAGRPFSDNIPLWTAKVIFWSIMVFLIANWL